MAAWYREWFGEEYLELYANRDSGEAERQADFVARHLGPEPPRAVLDLACGAGRHTAALRRRGYRVVGVDLSLTLLSLSPELPRVAGDMRRLPFAAESFDWVLNFFTSFGYFEAERENFRVLEEIVRLLAPGGRLLMDFLNSERAIATLIPHEARRVGDKEVEIERSYDPDRGRIVKQIRIQEPGRPVKSFVESVRAYRAEEITCGMRWAGLEICGVFGGFDGSSWDAESERLIVVGHRPDRD